MMIDLENDSRVHRLATPERRNFTAPQAYAIASVVVVARIQLIMTRLYSSMLLVLLLASLGFAESATCPPFPSRVDIENGAYSSQPGVTFRLRGFVADMVSSGKRSPLCFTRVAVVERGEVFVSNESLSHIFEMKLKQANSKISDVKIEMGEGTARLTGKVKKVVAVSFTIEGPVSTDGTLITLEGRTIKGDGVPVKGLLQMVGAHLSSLLSGSNVNGVKVSGNILSFEPEQLAHIRGHIDQAVASVQGLTLKYRDTRAHKNNGGGPAPPK